MSEQTLTFPQPERDKLEPHLPPPPPAVPETTVTPLSQFPFVTLTFATSLDSALSLAPGVRTALSGPQSKAMTHYLRSRHDAICVGVGTAVADDPGLNCRLRLQPLGGDAQDPTSGAASAYGQQPRPVVIDPTLRWQFTRESKVMQLARAGRGLAPYILTAEGNQPPADQKALLEGLGGKYIVLPRRTVTQEERQPQRRFQWRDILRAVRAEGLRSIMVEGGGEVINSLLEEDTEGLVDSVILTLAPTWLGQGGVVVSPARRIGPHGEPIPAVRLADTTWIPLGEDVVLCGKISTR